MAVKFSPVFLLMTARTEKLIFLKFGEIPFRQLIPDSGSDKFQDPHPLINFHWVEPRIRRDNLPSSARQCLRLHLPDMNQIDFRIIFSSFFDLGLFQ
jgi:hypothetical protein